MGNNSTALDQGTTFMWTEQYGRQDTRRADRLRNWAFGALLMVAMAGTAAVLNLERPASGTSWARAALIYHL